MGIAYNTSIVRDGLVLQYDANNIKSYVSNPLGSSIKDLSGRGKDGTFSAIKPTLVEGSPNYFSFTQTTDDRIRSPNSVDLSAKEVTVSCWVKVSAHVSFHNFVQNNWVNNGWLLYGSTGGFIFGIAQGGAQYNRGYATTTTEWSHLTGVYDGSFVRLYLNADEAASPIAISNATLDTGQILYIGDNSVTADHFISDVLVYNRALSASEVTTNFEATRGRFGV